jgi:hypothetical protein
LLVSLSLSRSLIRLAAIEIDRLPERSGLCPWIIMEVVIDGLDMELAAVMWCVRWPSSP